MGFVQEPEEKKMSFRREEEVVFVHISGSHKFRYIYIWVKFFFFLIWYCCKKSFSCVLLICNFLIKICHIIKIKYQVIVR